MVTLLGASWTRRWTGAPPHSSFFTSVEPLLCTVASAAPLPAQAKLTSYDVPGVSSGWVWMPSAPRPPSGPVAATWTRRPGPHPLGWDPALYCRHTAHSEEPFVLEAFFSALLILVCVGVLAFTVVAVKKLYQGQR